MACDASRRAGRRQARTSARCTKQRRAHARCAAGGIQNQNCAHRCTIETSCDLCHARLRPSTRLLLMIKHAPFRPHSLFSLLCTALAILLLCTSLGLAEGIASALGIGLDSFAQRNVTNWVHFQKDFLPSFKSVECYESSTFQFSQVWDKRGSTLHFELLASDVGSSGLFVREEGWAGLLSPSSGWRNWKLGKKICTVP